MKVFMGRVFLAHPRSVNETYFQHLKFTIKKSFFLLKTAGALLAHGLVPNCFETYTRDNITNFANTLQKRNPPAPTEDMFWDILSEKLAKRDVVSVLGEATFSAMSKSEQHTTLAKYKQTYLENFEKKGLSALKMD